MAMVLGAEEDKVVTKEKNMKQDKDHISDTLLIDVCRPGTLEKFLDSQSLKGSIQSV